MPLERLHGRDSRSRNATPRLRPTPVRRDQRVAVAQRTERSRAATRREPVPRFRRQLLSLQFFGSQSRGRGLGAEAGLRLFSERQTGLGISLNARTTHWTNRLVALLRLIPLRLNCVIASSQEAPALQRVYAIRRSGATCLKQTSSFDIAVTQRRRILLTQRKLTCVNIEAPAGAPQFPTWG